MKQMRCPICKRSIGGAGEGESEYFPFCSERCRQVDLGVWFSGGYVIEGSDKPVDDLADESLEG